MLREMIFAYVSVYCMMKTTQANDEDLQEQTVIQFFLSVFLSMKHLSKTNADFQSQLANRQIVMGNVLSRM